MINSTQLFTRHLSCLGACLNRSSHCLTSASFQPSKGTNFSGAKVTASGAETLRAVCHSTKMEQQPEHASASRSQPTAKGALDFFMLLQNLKLSKRTGWVRKGVNQPESIADHMYRMGMMSLVATGSGVDVHRCIKMSIIHDVAESIVGDITPHCNVSKEDKFRMEREAVQTIKQMLGEDTAVAKDVESLWLEYEEGTSPEALFVKDMDKLEMIIQAHEYEEKQGIDLSDFFSSTAGKFQTATGQTWAAELIARREAAKAAKHKQQIHTHRAVTSLQEAADGSATITDEVQAV